MIGTPGLIKFFWPKDNVETKHNSIFDIPIMDINKKVLKLDPSNDQKIVFVHIQDCKKNLETVRKIEEKCKSKVYIIPDQNSKDSFEEIRKVFPNALGKMIFNGPDAHPLSKYLRKGALKLYDFDMFGANKSIPLDVFEVNGEKINYYAGDRVKNYLSTL